MGLIYRITSPSGRIYIGKTTDIKKRLKHYRCKISNKKLRIIDNSILKYGWDAHILDIVENDIEEEKLDSREIFWIKELGTYYYENKKGMNMTKGGDGQRNNWKHDKERVKKASEKYSGDKNPFYGKTHPIEWRKQKSKDVTEYNKKNGIDIPKWGREKGRLAVIKPVLYYDVNGSFIKEFVSITDCANYLGINHSSISDCISKGSVLHAKYIFLEKKSDNFEQKIEPKEIKYKTIKRPIYLLDKNLILVKIYPSSLEASMELNVPKTTINRAAQYNNLHPIKKGYIFAYESHPHIVGRKHICV